MNGRIVAARGLRGFADGFVSVVLPSYLALLGFSALEIGALSFDGVRVILEGLKEAPAKLFCLEGRLHLTQVYVASPDLSAYGCLTAEQPAVSVALLEEGQA